ncbi:MAG TPA: tetratricopeptide repeat protein [Chitinophagaceae bacterium]|nr:tetratricopeptide repeat protein [Chitinophagaceae bacterium]
MAEVKHTTTPVTPEHKTVDRTQEFWAKYSKQLSMGLLAIIVLVGGYLAYNSFFKEPNEQKAEEAVFRAEEYFRMDSLDKALNGDGISQGFLRVISRYGGTDAGNRARFYAGSIYLKKGDFKNAIKHLEEFETEVEQLEAKKWGLLADAHSELGFSTNSNNEKQKAAELYEKAAGVFPKDDVQSSEFLFRAGYLYESLGKNKEAIAAYKQIKEKYPQTQHGFDIDKYLARLGEVQ